MDDDFSFYERSRLTTVGEAAGQLDPARRLRQARRMQEIVMSDAPVAPLMQPVVHLLCGRDVGGFAAHPV